MPEYFYGSQSDQFTFYRVPTALFTDSRFREITTDAKLLYGILLRRMELSAKKGWIDSLGRVYIIFTLEEVMEKLSCGDRKATKLLNELEEKAGLIERKRQGQGKPNLIYVKNFIDDGLGPPGQRFKTRQNNDSGTVRMTIQDSLKSRGSNKDISDIDSSDNNLIFPDSHEGVEAESETEDGTHSVSMEVREKYGDYFRWSLETGNLVRDHPGEKDLVEGILELLVDTCSADREEILVGREWKPAEAVRGRLMKLTSEHIRYVLECLGNNRADIRNVRKYLLASLYNAPVSMAPYYQAKVSRDRYLAMSGTAPSLIEETRRGAGYPDGKGTEGRDAI